MNGVGDVQKAIDFMENNLMNDICIDDVSKHIHTSKDYFQRIFFIVTGCAIGEYIRNRRLALAAQDLLFTKLKIIDISYKYMYESPESFTKAFSRLYGYPPSHVRTHKVIPEYFYPFTIQTIIKGGFNLKKHYWINPLECSFNNFLLLERFQISMLFRDGYWLREAETNVIKERKQKMGIALNANPSVLWYLQYRCPECAYIIKEIAENAPKDQNEKQIREAEIYVMTDSDYITYTAPEVMSGYTDALKNWDKECLFKMADFSGKTVLDVGSGSGRLAFAAAEKAMWVYASEPVGMMREFMRDKIIKENITNVRVLDGFYEALPFPDNTFDIVMHGHVFDIDDDTESAEAIRVCKPGGWLLDCPLERDDDGEGKRQVIK